MCGGQVLVCLVQCVSIAIVAEHHSFSGCRLSTRLTFPGTLVLDRVLVDVIAQEEHHIQIRRRQVLVRAEVTVLPLLTRRPREIELAQRLTHCGCGFGAAHRTGMRPHEEPIEVFASGLEASDIDVDRPAVELGGELDAFATDPPEVLVGRNLPPHRHHAGIHTAQRSERIGSEPGPQHRIGQWVAGGHAETEGVVGFHHRLCVRGSSRQFWSERKRPHQRTPRQELSTRGPRPQGHVPPDPNLITPSHHHSRLSCRDELCPSSTRRKDELHGSFRFGQLLPNIGGRAGITGTG